MPEFPTRPSTRSRGQRGVSMIEVMVSCLVLSAGLAVIAAMQTRAITRSSNAAAQATIAQALWSFGEARLVILNRYYQNGSSSCGGVVTSTWQTDLDYFNVFLDGHTNCGAGQISETNATQLSDNKVCFKPVGQTRKVVCTLPGDTSATELRSLVMTP